MERRNFLQGIFGGIAAAGAGVIVKATPREIERFASPLAKNEPMVIETPRAAVMEQNEQNEWLLFDRHGTPVVVLTKIESSPSQMMVDVTRHQDEFQLHHPKPRYMRLTVEGRVIDNDAMVAVVGLKG